MDKDYKNFVERMGSFEMDLDLNDLDKKKELAHHGILGMKWGVRRSPEQLGRIKTGIDESSKITREAKKISESIKNVRSASKIRDLSDLSDKELRDIVNRMNMEQQFTNLTMQQTTKGREYVRDTLEVAGGALTITSSAIAIAIAIKQLKG